MAVVANKPVAKGNTLLVEYDNMKNGDTGDPVLGFDYSDITVQIDVVTLGTGGTIDLEGSNDGLTWQVLTDPQGGDLTFTADGLKQVTEACKFYRPNINGGDGTTDMNVWLFMRRQR